MISIEDSAWFWLMDTLSPGWNRYFKYVNEVYDVRNNLVSTTGQEWQDNAWVNYSQYSFTYDGSNNRLSRLQTNWDGSAWVNSSHSTFTYDGNDNQTGYLLRVWVNSDWVNSFLGTYNYDENNNQESFMEQNWSGSAWINSIGGVYTYDSSNFPLTRTCKYWSEDGSQVVQGDSTCYYFHTVMVGIYNLMVQDGQINIFPNPGSGKFTISSNSGLNAIDVYNMAGELVYADGNFHQQASIDLSGHCSGIYVVKMNDGMKGSNVRLYSLDR